MTRVHVSIVAACLMIAGAGCRQSTISSVPFINGEAPTSEQLAQMTDAQKDAALAAYVKAHPIPPVSQAEQDAEARQARSADMQGTPEKIADVATGTHAFGGMVRFVKQGGHERIILSDDFAIDPAPNTRILVTSQAHPQTAKDASASGVVDIGALRQPTGGQAYDVPASVDLSSMNSVIFFSPMFARVIGVASVQ